MSTFHISPETGKPAVCAATVRACPVGGDHYPTAEAAREGYEASNATATLPAAMKKAPAGQQVVSLVERRETKAADAEALIARSADEQNYAAAIQNIAVRIEFSKADAKLLQDVAEGKRPKAEKLDVLLHDKKDLGMMSPYRSAEETQALKNVLNHLTAVRSTYGTPSTLTTVGSFDPATHTMFSNEKARTNPAACGRALTREVAHGEWMRNLAGENERAANSDNYSEDEAQAYATHAIHLRNEARVSDAKVAAQIQEIQYLHDTSEEWRSKANMETKAYLGRSRTQENGMHSLKDVPVTSVRKLRA